MTQSSTSESSKECSSSAFNFYKESKEQGKKHVCDDCKKEFPFFCRLKAHMSIHIGEKPFVCKTCQMAFNQSHNLKIHMRTHTGRHPTPAKFANKHLLIRPV
ncbi:hypothetical protein CEXT_680451 [Caerostris extrusa]|uniref:C2H2-type domain-containing protein n=1 Tax=Caerostris extrusa TaxID=172846 RepID=A0AAV4PN76_CAEEX|nr:hypothetical protein CEXT_680451 [Caerostris extrusa]